MSKSKIFKYLIAYAMWAVDIALGFWTFLLSRQAIQAGLAAFYIDGTLNRRLRATFIDRAGTLFIGLAWLVYILIIEEYLRVGVEKNELPRRIARTTGPMVLFITVVDLFMAYAQGFAAVGPLRWGVIALELAAGVIITWLGFQRKPAQRPA